MSQLIKSLKPLWEEKTAIVVDIFHKIKITPNILTLTGLVFIFVGSYFIYIQDFFKAGLFILIGNLFDALDGSLARRYNLSSKFGAFLDSVIDRISDIVPLLVLLYNFKNDPLYFILTSMAIVGSLMTSYTKARAEGLGVECNIGLLERPERSIILIAGLLLSAINISIILISIGSTITTIQRIVWVYKKISKEFPDKNHMKTN